MLSRQGFACVLVALVCAAAGCVSVNTNVVVEGVTAVRPVSPEQLPINHFQFFGSHNSYKTAMAPEIMRQLASVNPAAAKSLEYWHEPLADQLDLGLRVLEIDVFYDPDQRLFARGGVFPVLHVQNLDTGSHCPHLTECIDQITAWSRLNPEHEPLLISFNAKTDTIDRPGFVKPNTFDARAWREFDAALRNGFGRDGAGSRILNPAEVLTPDKPRWPTLAEARGRVLLLLDEGEEKSRAYHNAVPRPALFANMPADSPRAAIQVLNDPLVDAVKIRKALARGMMVRTRADADTLEARTGDTRRRDAAFASGAHFISTDYYRPSHHFGTDYVVSLPNGHSSRCNPKVVSRICAEAEHPYKQK